MQKLGSYQIIAQLGRGGMGYVLKGFDEKLHRHVAIKLLAPELARDRDSVERFLREARAMARVNDPHVVQVFGADTEGEQTYMVMELVEGLDLSQILKAQGAQKPPLAVDWIRQAAIGLKAAHEAGLLHRDMKLSNLMLNAKGRIKVADFGIALAQTESATRLTGTGIVVGTPGCMAPEVCQGKEADQRSDIYALGVALFELLTARRPFVAETPLAVMLQTVEQNPPDVRSINAQLDENLASILLRMLSRDPTQRIQTCDELIYLLDAWQALQNTQGIAQTSAIDLLKATRESAKNQVSSGRFSSLKRLNVLAETRRPIYLMGLVSTAFLISIYAQYWLGSNLYADLADAGNGYRQDFEWVKRSLLFTAAASALAYGAFAFWWIKTYSLIARVRAQLRPRDSRIALVLMSVPVLNWYFSFRLWRSLKAHAQPAQANGEVETLEPASTLLWLWWISFHLSVALSALALWITPNPLQGGSAMVYSFTLEIFARGLWAFAAVLCLAMMLRISWRIWRWG